jgi:tryptophanyl-tRNA synthetase
VLLSALCENASPEQVALDIGSRGAADLKRRAIEAVNERLRPIRERRAELISDRAYLRQVLLDGIATARDIAQDTLRQVSAAMHTQY